jgi:uncharacterized protein
MTPSFRSCLYRGTVMHARLHPFVHRYRYKVLSWLFDIDELPDLGQTKPFAYNQKALISFYDKDHGPRDGTPLRPWIESLYREHDLAGQPERIMLLCWPRILGHVFNPLSVYFCYQQENLSAVFYEVKNTFGEQHIYAFEIEKKSEAIIEHKAKKNFYVSPLIPMQADYHFRLRSPAEELWLTIAESVDNKPQLFAEWLGRQEPLTPSAMWRALIHFPLLSIKILFSIHWQALQMWVKGATYYSKPAPPEAHSEKCS